ncbi:MAG: Ppx/GppA family phosphatase [Gammaproteobacteria bacterium]|nr:Ppx/GppA family phosphatase [Gammaproteobacteria bacterium]
MTEQETVSAAEDHGRILAAVDLGSNSFHMIVARIDSTGSLFVIDRLRETVRLGGGLTRSGRISGQAKQRALDCLERFGQRIRDLPGSDVRVVGTKTLREARNADDFIKKAQKYLNHPVEIISGLEEARLIYLGVAYGHAATDNKRLVIDIGGGSTELIVGKGMEPIVRDSIGLGSVSTSLEHFPDGEISPRRMLNAVMETQLEIYPVADKFTSRNWQQAVGCSGSIRAIRAIVQEEGWCSQGISLKSLYMLRDHLIQAGHIDNIQLKKVKDDRIPILPGGVAVLTGIFEALHIESLEVSDQALREGLLYELIGRIQHRDIRSETVDSTRKRWNIDAAHADRVTSTAKQLFKQVRSQCGLKKQDGMLLQWAAELHEIGLQISHSQYHKHSEYLLKNMDLPGFSRTEQTLLAALVRNQRRQYCKKAIKILPKSDRNKTRFLSLLLRVAVLLHRGRSDGDDSGVIIHLSRHEMILKFSKEWLDQHPLTHADLIHEKNYLESLDIEVRVESIEHQTD